MRHAATSAIARSVSHTEIVTLEYDSAIYAELLELCDDYASNPELRKTELWGTDADGNEWRVHMRAEPEKEWGDQ